MIESPIASASGIAAAGSRTERQRTLAIMDALISSPAKQVQSCAAGNVESVAAMHGGFTAELTVEPYLSGVRIDSFLVRHFRNYTPYRMQRMVRAGQARVDGLPAGVEQRVFRGQRVSIRLIEGPDKLFEPISLPVDVLYEDSWLLAVNKPAGQVTHPVGVFQTGTLSNALQSYLDRQTSKPGLLRPGIVHRLDRMTSGVLVVSKEHISHRKLSIQFQRGEVRKSYLAVVEGLVEQSCGTIDLPIGRQPAIGSILMCSGPEARNPRPARTRFRVFARFDDRTLLEAQPLTGRIHQVRVHLAAVGHPIVGDVYYRPFGEICSTRKEKGPWGTSKLSDRRGRCENARPGCENGDAAESRHLLHAHRLLFAHPIHGDRRVVEAPLPDDMRAVIGRLVKQ